MRDFTPSTLRALGALGIQVLGSQAAPAYPGDVYWTGRAYRLDDNGTHRVRSHAEVLKLAQS